MFEINKLFEGENWILACMDLKKPEDFDGLVNGEYLEKIGATIQERIKI